ncbi:MAG: hypothetical protein ACI396_05495 [Acutalibacteraceae bacterium]
MKDEKSIAEVLRQIAKSYGTDVFREQKRAYALITDLAPGDARAKERRRIKAALESGAVDILLKATEDSAGSELYINESVTRLIAQTDMADDIARETIMTIADALSVSPSAVTDKGENTKESKKITDDAQTAKPQEKPKDYTEYGVGFKVPKFILIGALALCGVFAIVGFVALFLNLDWTGKQWFIGIGSGAVLTAGIIGLSFLLENKIYNEKCQTITIALPILFAVNIVLRAVLGDAAYGLIFHIMSVWIVAGAIANTVLTRVELEEKWTWPNIVVAVCSTLLFFFWPGNFSWTIWQWIIGIGGGLVLCALAIFVAFILDEIGPETHQSLSVILLIFTIVNLTLLFTVGQNYLIIAQCFMVMLAIGAIITAVMSFVEVSSGFGWLNVILALINGGIFLFVVIGSYEQLMKLIQLPFDKIKQGS